MKILSWNIRQGGGTRSEAISNALITEGCDMIVLSEFQNNAAGQLIRIKVLMNGYFFQSPSSEDKKKNGVLIAARKPFSFILDTHTLDFPESVIKQNGYRYDHTWISKKLESIIKECYYLYEWRKQGMSDHSPMILHLSQPTN